LATSGIDNSIKIWSPFNGNERNVQSIIDINSACLNNQQQMHSHPFEYLFMNLAQSKLARLFFFLYIFIFFSFLLNNIDLDDGNSDDDDDGSHMNQSATCRPS
jgi:hypothetical protein